MSATAVKPPGFFPPPPGVEPNFTNPEHITGGLVPLVAIFLPISTVFLALRLYTKGVLIKIVGWEDVIITVAWVCNVILCSILIRGLGLGSGIHMWDMTIPRYETWAKNVYIAISFYVPTAALAKVAILLFYLRLNPTASFRYSVIGLIYITTVYMIIVIFVQIFTCNPVSKFWDLSLATTGTCLDVAKVYLANPIINTIIDVLVLLVPIPMLLNLHVSQRYKLGLGLLFTTGSSTVIISAVRIWAIARANLSKDISWNVTTSTSLIVVETNLTVTCGCIIMLRPLLRHYFPGLVTRRSKRSGPTSGQSPGAKALDRPTVMGSHSQYRAKVSGNSGGSKPRSGNHRGWPQWSWSATVKSHDEDEDMEGLNTELGQFRPALAHAHVQRGRVIRDDDGKESGEGDTHGKAGGDVRGDLHQDGVSGGSWYGARPKDMEDGIIKTVSLDIR